MSRLKQLIHEIHRRSLWQVLGIYVLGSWLALQAVDTLAGALNLPDWAPALCAIVKRAESMPPPPSARPARLLQLI